MQGTPSTPGNLYSPSSDSDIMSPPPLKRNKSRRGLGPLMEHQGREQSVIYSISSNEENQSYFPHYSYVDENAYGGSFYNSTRVIPPSPLRTRVLNIDNIQHTPVKSSYKEFDIDGIKPLSEHDEDLVYHERAYVTSEPIITNSPSIHLMVKDDKRKSEYDVGVKREIRQEFSVSVPSVRPPEHLLEDDQLPAVVPEVEKSEDLALGSLFNEDVHVNKSAFNSNITESVCGPSTVNITKVSVINSTVPSCSENSENTSYKKEQENRDVCNILPKKKWMRAHLNRNANNEENTNRQSVVVRTPLSNLCQNQTVENKTLMGAVALVQFSAHEEDFSQPLNLSTSKSYST